MLRSISPTLQPGGGVIGRELQRAGSPPGVVGTQPASAYCGLEPASLRASRTGMVSLHR